MANLNFSLAELIRIVDSLDFLWQRQVCGIQDGRECHRHSWVSGIG